MSTPTMRQRPAGWWYPWIFVVGMLVVIAVNAVMIALAVDTFSGLETDDAYRKGIQYNKTIAAAEAQAARGWQMTLVVEPRPAGEAAASGGRTADMVATFTDRDGYPLHGLEVEAHLIRPTSAGHDSSVTLTEQAEGRYATTLAIPLPGQWDVRVHARRDDATYQATHRIILP